MNENDHLINILTKSGSSKLGTELQPTVLKIMLQPPLDTSLIVDAIPFAFCDISGNQGVEEHI